MNIHEVWFVIVAVLFIGYFVLEGFDFGVGMLFPVLGRTDTRRRVLLNTIGPVWDGNEVWLIAAVGAMFAAFPEWYASLFAGFYLLLLPILFTIIVRVCAIEWRGKIDDPAWRSRCDLAIMLGSWMPAFGWGCLVANLVRGVPMTSDKHVDVGVFDVLNPYALLGGATTVGLFLLHGTVFVALKSAGDVSDDAVKLARRLVVPVAIVVTAFALWTQLAHGKSWTWVAFGVVALALAAVAGCAIREREGWAFVGSAFAVLALFTLLFGSLFPNVMPSTTAAEFGLDVYNASSTPYTLKLMTWAALAITPVVVCYQAWSYWVFRKRISTTNIPPSIGLPARARE